MWFEGVGFAFLRGKRFITLNKVDDMYWKVPLWGMFQDLHSANTISGLSAFMMLNDWPRLWDLMCIKVMFAG